MSKNQLGDEGDRRDSMGEQTRKEEEEEEKEEDVDGEVCDEDEELSYGALTKVKYEWGKNTRWMS